jgi:drug/metabolite transporter (DMT)-like permease
MMPVNPILRGVALMVASQFVFLLNDALVKLASEELPMGEIIFLRGVVAVVLIGSLAFALGLHRRLGMLWHRLVAWRVIGEVTATFFYLASLIQMPIANVTIIFQAVPLSVTAGSALFLGERVGWRRWGAIVVGFIGVLIVVRPGVTGFDMFSLLVLASVLCASVRDLTTRALPAVTPTLLVTLATAIAVTVFGAALGLGEGWVQPSWTALFELAGAALLLSVGYFSLILALRVGEMSVTAVFRYVAVVFAIALGILIWGDVPDAFTLLGSAIIVGTGLYTLYRERLKRASGAPMTAATAATQPATGG